MANPEEQPKTLSQMEVDALLTKYISFVTEEYLPKKLRDKDYLQ